METEFPSSNQIDADQRAFQLAIEYSMLGLTSDDDNTTNTFDELRAKKSVNMTECVAVPSSEHVAEIVGRQGDSIYHHSGLVPPNNPIDSINTLNKVDSEADDSNPLHIFISRL